jgi:capsular exopolysaccharide synthesis family protein
VATDHSRAAAADNLFRLAWQSRWIIVITVVVTLVAGFAYIRRSTPVFRSTSKLYVSEYHSIPELQARVPQRYNLYTQAALVRSIRILAAALDGMDTRSMATFGKTDNPIALLERRLKVSVGNRDDIISVSIGSPSPTEAAEIVNAVVSAFVADHDENKRKTSADVLEGLRKERDKTKSELAAKRLALADLKKANELLALETDGGSVVTLELQSLSRALDEMRISRIRAEAFYEGVKQRASDPAGLRQYILSPETPAMYDVLASRETSLRQTLFELQLKREDLISDGLTAKHPEVLAVDEKMKKTQAQCEELDAEYVRTQLDSAEQRCLDARENEQRIAELLAEKRKQASELNEYLVEYQLLLAEEQELAAYQRDIEQQIREIDRREDLAIEPMKIRVMELARPADYPSEPKKGRIMAAALVVGLLLGGSLAVLRDMLDQTLRSADEISSALGLPVLGVIPAMSRRQQIPMRGQKVRLQPDSQEAEAFRTVRTAIFFGAPAGNAKTILVTSPASGDGKSTVASNLAIAMAQAGQRTLLLDADFRKPVQHTVFGVNHHGRGLMGVLTGKMKVGEAMQPTEVKHLSLLTRGFDTNNPAEILNSRMFAKLLERLGEAFDRVIVDAPPVTVVTDAQILGAISDVTLLVLRADKSTRKVSLQAIDALNGVGARLLGTIVNDVRHGDGRYGYYGRYGVYSYEHQGSGGNDAVPAKQCDR